MPDAAPARMNADAFIRWAMEQPEDQRYELHAGRVVAMAPERNVHALLKAVAYRRLAEAVERAGVPCDAYPDGMAVRIDDATVYEPDALVRCGPPLPDDAVQLNDPMIVVDVLSLSTQSLDKGGKLIDYFRLPSVRHYLIVRPEDQVIVHHARRDDGSILTSIIRDGSVVLDPPGISVTGVSLARR